MLYTFAHAFAGRAVAGRTSTRRGGRRTTTTTAAPVQAPAAQVKPESAYWAAHKHQVKLTKGQGDMGRIYGGRVDGTDYAVVWSPADRVWMWSIVRTGTNGKGRKVLDAGTAADRKAAFEGLNAAARVQKVAEVRA